jgi:protein O-GlcNAc transferase
MGGGIYANEQAQVNGAARRSTRCGHYRTVHGALVAARNVFCEGSKRGMPPEPPTRAEAGLPDGAFVFCCFNNTFKITPPVFAIWMRLLREIDGSVAWLSHAGPATQANLRKESAKAGIDPARVIFAPRVASNEDHLSRQQLADLFLDTLPYNTHTAAADALWAGLPVVTCAGETFPARVAGSLLRVIGAPELITESLAGRL